MELNKLIIFVCDSFLKMEVLHVKTVNLNYVLLILLAKDLSMTSKLSCMSNKSINK